MKKLPAPILAVCVSACIPREPLWYLTSLFTCIPKDNVPQCPRLADEQSHTPWRMRFGERKHNIGALQNKGNLVSGKKRNRRCVHNEL